MNKQKTGTHSHVQRDNSARDRQPDRQMDRTEATKTTVQLNNIGRVGTVSFARFDVIDTLSQPSPEWSGQKGRVTKQMLEDFFPSSDQEGVLVCYCGNLAFNTMMRRQVMALNLLCLIELVLNLCWPGS